MKITKILIKLIYMKCLVLKISFCCLIQSKKKDEKIQSSIRKDLTRAQIKTLTGHSDWISSLAVLKSGDLASGSYDKTIKIWDSSTGSMKRT
jgi:WD40 repeat protein